MNRPHPLTRLKETNSQSKLTELFGLLYLCCMNLGTATFGCGEPVVSQRWLAVEQNVILLGSIKRNDSVLEVTKQANVTFTLTNLGMLLLPKPALYYN